MDLVFRRLVGVVWLVVASLSLTACSEMPEVGTPADFTPQKVESQNIAKAYYKVGDVYLAGQPNEAGFADLKKDGVRTVINLRPDSELGDLPEQQLVEAQGMEYVHIPVSSQKEHALQDATIERFIEAIDTAQKPVVIHCGSANRVSALWAAYLAKEKGVPPEEAISLAEMSGLRTGYARDFVVDYMDRECGAPPAEASEAEASTPEE